MAYISTVAWAILTIDKQTTRAETILEEILKAYIVHFNLTQMFFQMKNLMKLVKIIKCSHINTWQST